LGSEGSRGSKSRCPQFPADNGKTHYKMTEKVTNDRLLP
jgi:hypothetical protein